MAYEQFYAQELPNPTKIFQGEIFKDQLIITIPSDIKILRLDNEDKYVSCNPNELSDAFQNQTPEDCIANAVRTKIIVLSNTCDIDNRDLISVAPIISLNKIENEDKKGSIRKRKINYMFYLPPFENFEESFADLNLINCVKKEILKLEQRINSLAPYAIGWLQDTFYRYYCRPVYIEKVEYIKPPEDKA